MSAVKNRTDNKKRSNNGPAKDKELPITLQATVSQVLPKTMFRVTLPNGRALLAYPSGKMRTHFIRLSAGDMVQIEVSPYDLTKARIVYRL